MKRRPTAAVLLVLLALPLHAEEIPADYLPIDKARTYEPAGRARAGYLGAVFDKASQQYGVKVGALRSGSPAEAAGVRAGDVITVFDRIRTPGVRQLTAVLRSKRAGERVEIVLYRGGQRSTAALVLARALRNTATLGLLRLSAPVAASSDGVPVARVAPGSPADQAGLKAGDTVIALDGKPTLHRDPLDALLATRLAGERCTLTVRRGGAEQKLALTLGADPRALRARPERGEPKRAFKLAVLLVEFADVRHDARFAAADFERALLRRKSYTKGPGGEATHGSMADYYHEVSGGIFALTGKVFDWVTLSSKKDDWRNRTSKECRGLIQQAVARLTAREGARALAGYEGLAVVYAGRVEHPRGRALWPHRSSVSLGSKGRRRRLPFYITSELRGKAGGFSGISIHCHEFGHMLGLPDQYSTVAGKGMDLGPWCLMARAHRKKEGAHRPVHLCAWCKIRLGWLVPTTIDPRAPQKLALRPVEQGRTQCLKVPLRAAANEYLLLAYRHTTGYDRTLPRAGLLVWHVSGARTVDLLEAHGKRSSRRWLREVPFPTATRDTLVVDPALPDLQTAAEGRWAVRIGGIKQLDGTAVLLEVGPPAGGK